MTILDIFSKLTEGLSPIYPEGEVHSISYLLVEELTGFERYKIHLHLDDEIDEKQVAIFVDALKRLKNHEPIQYVLGSVHFFGMKLKVNRDVLIPRPETEELLVLVNEAIEADILHNDNLHVLDIGTGNGCIPLAIKKSFPQVVASSVDVSKKALQLAKENAKELNLEIEFAELNILTAEANDLPEFDILVSNPPYVLKNDSQHMAPNVLEYEPSLALFPDAGDDLVFYRKILSLFDEVKQKGKRVFLEIHRNRGEAVFKITEMIEWSDARIQKDMHGNDRFFVGLV